MINRERVGVIILGAGEGKRMKSDVPKVLVPLHGKPMISYVLHAVEHADVNPHPVIVVGFKSDVVMNALGSEYTYALQTEQLGTGHAVLQAYEIVKDAFDHIVVLYGDQPHITSEVINQLVDTHVSHDATMSLMTITVPDFEEWRAGLFNFSRVIRNDAGEVVRTIERKDASEDELRIRELNPAFFCFRASWLWEQLPKLGNNNAQHEFYLTDLLEVATRSGEKVASFSGDPLVALGANTKEELQLLEDLTAKTLT